MSEQDLYLENLVSPSNRKAEEIARDYDAMTVELRGVKHRRQIVQLRVMLDNHREQRRLTTAEQRARGVRNPAQVAWLFFDGRFTWLRGYAWAFDLDAKSFTTGRLTEMERARIEELANEQLEHILPKVKEYNEKYQPGRIETEETAGETV